MSDTLISLFYGKDSMRIIFYLILDNLCDKILT